MRPTKPDASPTRSQRGVVLLLALIMLVAMTLAGIVMYRQIGTGLIITQVGVPSNGSEATAA